MRVDKLNIENDYRIPKKLARILARPAVGKLSKRITQWGTKEVPDHFVGLLFVDGVLTEILEPGLHVYWKFQRSITVELVDTRVQVMEVSGQEILTKDKVTLRVNVVAHYQVADPKKARSTLVNFTDYLYRELQFAIRQAISKGTLDTLLVDKSALDETVFSVISKKVEDLGLRVKSVGIKDIVLPGDMKNIFNQVVATEKAAQANVIKRREETAATRSLLNTAKLMDENPTLLRLKELETLEKLVEKVEKLTVFGGLDGVINEMVRINVPTR